MADIRHDAITNLTTIVLDEAEVGALQELLAHANGDDYEANYELAEAL
jgi:hypothetical protein